MCQIEEQHHTGYACHPEPEFGAGTQYQKEIEIADLVTVATVAHNRKQGWIMAVKQPDKGL